MSYVNFNDIEFCSPEQKIAAEELYKSIQFQECKMMITEEKIAAECEKMDKEKIVAYIAMFETYFIFNTKVLNSMKMTFWFLTGVYDDKILYDFTEEQKKDLFSYEES